MVLTSLEGFRSQTLCRLAESKQNLQEQLIKKPPQTLQVLPKSILLNMSNGTPLIPVVDLSPFTSGGDLAARKQAARDFAEKAHATGCLGITGHGVPPEMLQKAFQLSKKFFSLPYEEK